MKPTSHKYPAPLASRPGAPLPKASLPGYAHPAAARPFPAGPGSVTPARQPTGASNTPLFNRVAIIVWLSVLEAAKKLNCSTDTIERRAIPWQDQHVPFKIRFKYLVLDRGGQRTRRYYEPDLEALLYAPDQVPVQSRPRIIPAFIRKEAK